MLRTLLKVLAFAFKTGDQPQTESRAQEKTLAWVRFLRSGLPKLPYGHGSNQWYHFGIGAPPILDYLCGGWDVHWGYDLGFDPWPYVNVRTLPSYTHPALLALYRVLQQL